MAKRDPSAKLKRSFVFEQNYRESLETLADFLDPPDNNSEDTQWRLLNLKEFCADPRKWVREAVISLSLTDHPGDHAIRIAFERSGLDPEKPGHWKLLLSMFAESHFGRDRSGRRTTWDSSRLSRLLSDYAEVKYLNPQLRSDLAICEAILAHPELGAPYKARNVDAATLRRRLQYARDPAKNEALRWLMERTDEATALIFLSMAWRRRRAEQEPTLSNNSHPAISAQSPELR